jgi:chorismate mutase
MRGAEPGADAAVDLDRTREIEPSDDSVDTSPGSSVMSELELLRSEIGRVDRALVSLIAERVTIARKIGATKRAAGLPTLDPAREARLVRGVGSLAREAGFDADDLREIFWQLIALARRAQVEER